MTTHLAAPLSLLAALSAGCSDATPADACIDVVDALVDVGVRCGADRDQLRAALSNGSQDACANIVAIRAEAELYDECIPAL